MQIWLEQNNHVSATDAEDVERIAFCLLILMQILFSLEVSQVPFLIPKDNTCQGNSLLPNFNIAVLY